MMMLFISLIYSIILFMFEMNDFRNSLWSHSISIQEKRLSIELDNAAADCFYDKSESEYKLLQDQFSSVAKMLGLGQD